MSLDQVIPAEIKGDRFSSALERVAATAGVRNILEIGASSGDGSTAALVAGAAMNSVCPTIFCLEMSSARFAKLAQRYLNQPFVKPYNASSVSIGVFPSDQEVSTFWHSVPNNKLRGFALPDVLRWLHQDIAYLRTHKLPDNAISKIKQEHNIESFDAVLIDGSEFLGWAEFQATYGARFMMLDDILTFKNHRSYQTLTADTKYRLVVQDLELRHGFAIFERVS